MHKKKCSVLLLIEENHCLKVLDSGCIRECMSNDSAINDVTLGSASM